MIYQLSNLIYIFLVLRAFCQPLVSNKHYSYLKIKVLPSFLTSLKNYLENLLIHEIWPPKSTTLTLLHGSPPTDFSRSISYYLLYCNVTDEYTLLSKLIWKLITLIVLFNTSTHFLNRTPKECMTTTGYMHVSSKLYVFISFVD